MPPKLPPPLTPTYLVGVVNCDTPATTPAYQNPAHRTSMAFTFPDPTRAGKCLASLCRVSTVKDALTAALSSGYAPSQSTASGDAYLAGMCRPGDMWVCVLYDAQQFYRRILGKRVETMVRAANPPRVYYGFHSDLDKPITELQTVDCATVVDQAESFFLFAHVLQIG